MIVWVFRCLIVIYFHRLRQTAFIDSVVGVYSDILLSNCRTIWNTGCFIVRCCEFHLCVLRLAFQNGTFLWISTYLTHVGEARSVLQSSWVWCKNPAVWLGFGVREVPTSYLTWADSRPRRWKHRLLNRSWTSQRERHLDCWQPLTFSSSLEVCATCMLWH